MTDSVAVAAPDPCAMVPVHTIGTIQPHGLLFAVTVTDLIVQQVSANVETLLDMPPERVVGRSLEYVFGAKQFEGFRARLAGDGWPVSFRLRLGPDALEMDCTARLQDDRVVVELELADDQSSSASPSLSDFLSVPFLRMEQAADLAALTNVAASELRRITGFDRVMIYRFDDSWAGEVIAEAMTPDPVSYLGLHFPASDIPPQARRLFTMNRLRAIADVSAIAAPIVPAGQRGRSSLDLTYSHLRSAAPIHLEYLRNMGVHATLTISIIVDHRLWGMIACHNRVALRLDASRRTICELIGIALNAQVALRIENAALQERLETRRLLEPYMAGVERMGERSERRGFITNEVLAIFGADGCVSCLDGVVTYRGKTVSEEFLRPAITQLRALATRGIASSNKLRTLDPGAERYSKGASGALYVGLADGSSDYILLLRRELVETIDWAGNPDKNVNTDGNGHVHPRASFVAWRETVRGRSRRWTGAQLECASFLREQLLRLRELHLLREAKRGLN